MSTERQEIKNGEELEKVVGGFFHWNTNTNTMTYYHEDGSKTTHKILDAENGYALSNTLHGKKVPEDDILKQLIDKKYIQG